MHIGSNTIKNVFENNKNSMFHDMFYVCNLCLVIIVFVLYIMLKYCIPYYTQKSL